MGSGTTTYYHPDALSIRMSTNSSGTDIGEQGHYPYGETWYLNNSTTKWEFTTYERDSESGNDYAQARYNVNRLGRFSSPDPLPGSTSDPQSLNRYSYVRNLPTMLTDPTGMSGAGPLGCVSAGNQRDDTTGEGAYEPQGYSDPDADPDPPPQTSCLGNSGSGGGNCPSFLVFCGDASDYGGPQLIGSGWGGSSAGVPLIQLIDGSLVSGVNDSSGANALLGAGGGDAPLGGLGWDFFSPDLCGWLFPGEGIPGLCGSGGGPGTDWKQLAIQRARDKTYDALLKDGQCLALLAGRTANPLGTLITIAIGTADLGSSSINAVTNNPNSPGSAPLTVSSITINTAGWFFSGGGTANGVNTGSLRFQGLTLLHELGHATGAFPLDVGSNWTLSATIDSSVLANCAKALAALSNVPMVPGS